MLVDANLLLYAVDRASSDHAAASAWLEEVLNGDRRVGLPWQTIGAFVRIITHPRVTTDPLSSERAWAYVGAWLASGPAWIPPATERTGRVLQSLAATRSITGNLVPDAQLGALALEHGLEVMSADTDFAKFPEVRWRNPLA